MQYHNNMYNHFTRSAERLNRDSATAPRFQIIIRMYRSNCSFVTRCGGLTRTPVRLHASHRQGGKSRVYRRIITTTLQRKYFNTGLDDFTSFGSSCSSRRSFSRKRATRGRDFRLKTLTPAYPATAAPKDYRPAYSDCSFALAIVVVVALFTMTDAHSLYAYCAFSLCNPMARVSTVSLNILYYRPSRG